jgi:hypothetical protein
MNHRSRTALVLFCLLGMLVVGCAQPAPTVAPSSVPVLPSAPTSVPVLPSAPTSVPVLPPVPTGDWPTSGWRTSPPAAQGMDPQKLTLLLEDVEQKQLNCTVC